MQLGGKVYASVIAMVTMIHRLQGKVLTCETLLKEMHTQWCLGGGKGSSGDNIEDEEVALVVTNKKESKKGGKKRPTNPDAEKTCNRCKKKGTRGSQLLEEISRQDS